MTRLHTIASELTDDEFRTALLLGLASIPVSTGIIVGSPFENSALGVVLLAGLIAGYCYRNGPVTGDRAGAATGLVGSIPLLVRALWRGFFQPGGSEALIGQLSSSPVLTVVFFGLYLFLTLILCFVVVGVGAVGGWIGSWVSTRIGSDRFPGMHATFEK